MDVIWNCAFGVDIDCQRYPENKFYRKGVQVFDQGLGPRWNILLASKNQIILIGPFSKKIFTIIFFAFSIFP